jgi:YidC/Oxa1 family membrane protein insertase
MNPLTPLEDLFREILIFLHDSGNLTYGWCIVVLTVMVRVVILPLYVTQYRSARKMQALSPQIKELQKKYASDKKKQQEETMRLFQENKVNPFGSCLPMVVQIPVFLSLYFVLKNFEKHITDTAHLGFMRVIPDITQEFRTIGWGAAVIAVIYGLSQLLASELSITPTTPDLQKRLFRLMPIAIVGFLFIYNVPAGLVLYWMTTNLWTAGQQLILKRQVGPTLELAAAPVPAAAARGPSRTPAKQAEPAKTGQAKQGKQPRTRQKGDRAVPAAGVADGQAPEGQAPDGQSADGQAVDGQAVDGQAAQPREAPEPTNASPARDAPEPANAPPARDAPNGKPAGGQGQRRRPANRPQGQAQRRRPPKKRGR